MIKDYETETGSVYRIDHDTGHWIKLDAGVSKPNSDPYFFVQDLRIGNYDDLIDMKKWYPADAPVIGKSMYIFGKFGYSWISTEVVDIREVDDWYSETMRKTY